MNCRQRGIQLSSLFRVEAEAAGVVVVVVVVVVIRAMIVLLMYRVNDPSDTGVFTFYLTAYTAGL